MAAFQSPVTCQNTVGFENVFEAVQKLQVSNFKARHPVSDLYIRIAPRTWSGKSIEMEWTVMVFNKDHIVFVNTE